MAGEKVYGLDPDPVGATFVELEVQENHLHFRSWGLIRPDGFTPQHRVQLSLQAFAPLVQDAVVGIEVVEQMYQPGKQHAALQKTREMGEALLEHILMQTPWVFAFPGVARLSHEETFLEGSWVHRLTGFRYPRPSDVVLELRQNIHGTGHRLKNPHFRDALGVALLAYRRALNTGWSKGSSLL